MKTKHKILVWLGRIGFCVYLRCQIYAVWSRIYRWFWERKRRKALPQFQKLGDLVALIRTLKWRADGWRQLGDAISHPEHVQWLADNDPAREVGDCDDFAIYEVTALQQPELRRSYGIAAAEMLTVSWYKYGGKATEGNPMGHYGHNVCLIRYTDGKWTFMDYGWPYWRRDTVEEVVADVRWLYAPESYLVGWARSRADLRCTEVGW